MCLMDRQKLQLMIIKRQNRLDALTTGFHPDMIDAQVYNNDTDDELLDIVDHLNCEPTCDCKGINLFY